MESIKLGSLINHLRINKWTVSQTKGGLKSWKGLSNNLTKEITPDGPGLNGSMQLIPQCSILRPQVG